MIQVLIDFQLKSSLMLNLILIGIIDIISVSNYYKTNNFLVYLQLSKGKLNIYYERKIICMK